MNRYQKAAAIWGAEQIKRATEGYYQNPNICKNCGKIIEVNGKKVSQVRTKKFCDNSCAAQFNNISRFMGIESRNKIRDYVISQMITQKCEECNNEFRTPIKTPQLLCRKCRNHATIQLRNKGRMKYEKSCQQCGESFVTISKVQKFCSHSCSGKRSSESQNKRSKNEIYFSDLCRQKFSNVLDNVPMFNGWDADVILPDLKIAVLWNGNWHHKKITEKHSVKQVQNRDKIKIKEIIDAGYCVYIIDDFGKFKPSFVETKFNEFTKEINKNIPTLESA